MNPFEIYINEDRWLIYLIDDEDNVIADEGAAAETNAETREMYFRRGHLSLKNVAHELWHAFFHYLYIHDTTSLSLIDMEEITAALFADRAEIIIERAKLIHDKLLQLKLTEE